MLMNIVSILVMINNYFHDFATGIITVTTLIMFFTIKHAKQASDKNTKKVALVFFPKMVHITGGTMGLLLMAGIVRSFTYKWFEWIDALGQGQIYLLIFKHVIMFAGFAYALYLWAGMYKNIKTLRKEVK